MKVDSYNWKNSSRIREYYDCQNICIQNWIITYQKKFTEKGMKKTENVEHNVMLLLFLFILDTNKILWQYDRERERESGGVMEIS